MGFRVKRRRWMETCISTMSFLVLISGSLHGFFRSLIGLRWVILLSPFLFIIMMHMLSRLLLRAEEANVLEGFLIEGARRIGVLSLTCMQATHWSFAERKIRS
ncbi:hypothetical protein L1049_010413 [Liquidambar formosana]|uniref:Uncharacterized protein n=1 Tax=Liquidambar formosana TaxID=63359 RepID=A0AAP0R732_LIQFO